MHSRTREDPQNFFLSLNIWKMVYIDIIRMPCIGKKYLDSDLNIANHTHVPSQEVMLNMPNELFQCIMLRWGVPNWPPGENSIWCRKFSDGVESGGRVGTLRWAKEVPQCLVCRLIGGLLGVKKAKNGKMVIFAKKDQNSLIFSVDNAIHGPVGLKKHESMKWGHRWWGVDHRGV